MHANPLNRIQIEFINFDLIPLIWDLLFVLSAFWVVHDFFFCNLAPQLLKHHCQVWACMPKTNAYAMRASMFERVKTVIGLNPSCSLWALVCAFAISIDFGFYLWMPDHPTPFRRAQHMCTQWFKHHSVTNAFRAAKHWKFIKHIRSVERAVEKCRSIVARWFIRFQLNWR